MENPLSFLCFISHDISKRRKILQAIQGDQTRKEEGKCREKSDKERVYRKIEENYHKSICKLDSCCIGGSCIGESTICIYIVYGNE